MHKHYAPVICWWLLERIAHRPGEKVYPGLAQASFALLLYASKFVELLARFLVRTKFITGSHHCFVDFFNCLVFYFFYNVFSTFSDLTGSANHMAVLKQRNSCIYDTFAGTSPRCLVSLLSLTVSTK